MTKRHWNITFEELMEAWVLFRQDTRKWNPRMIPFILQSVNVFILQI